MKYDLICIGNITLDFYFKGESLTKKEERFFLAIGGKYFVDQFKESVGGGAVNVAIGTAKNGLTVSVCGKVGDNPFKKIILDKLRENKIAIELIQIEKNFLNISAILLTEEGERTIINFETQHQHLLKDNKLLPKIADTEWVYFGNLPDVTLTEKVEIAKYLKTNGVKIAMNIGVVDARKKLSQILRFLKYADVLILNTHEFSELVKVDYTKIDFRRNLLKEFPFLSMPVLITTDGENGSFGYTINQTFYQPAIKVKRVIDTTGAGDAYTAGFLSEFIKNQDIRKAMLKGAKYAVKILQKIGAN